jgi:glycerol-1-phosphatase
VLEIDGLLVDLDGCVWVGGEPLPGAVDAIRTVREHGLEVAFVTNDPAGTRSDLAERLTAVGIPTGPERVVSAGWALATRVADDLPDASVYVLGPAAMRTELRDAGLRPLGPRPRPDGEVGRADANEAIDAVAVGTSPDVGFTELTAAMRAVLAGARLYAANRDPWFPMPDGPWPSSGAFAAFLEAATGTRAIAIGKPEPALFDAARAQLGPSVARVAIVGDRRDADVAGGRRAGLTTILVGVGHGPGPVPDHHLAGLRELPALLGLTPPGTGEGPPVRAG